MKFLQAEWNLVFWKHNLRFKDWATFPKIKDVRSLLVLQCQYGRGSRRVACFLFSKLAIAWRQARHESACARWHVTSFALLVFVSYLSHDLWIFFFCSSYKPLSHWWWGGEWAAVWVHSCWPGSAHCSRTCNYMQFMLLISTYSYSLAFPTETCDSLNSKHLYMILQ